MIYTHTNVASKEINQLGFKYISIMHEFWTIPIAYMTYTRSQNDTNMMVGEHGIKRFEVVFVVLWV
jgi:hypothetical protein